MTLPKKGPTLDRLAALTTATDVLAAIGTVDRADANLRRGAMNNAANGGFSVWTSGTAEYLTFLQTDRIGRHLGDLLADAHPAPNVAVWLRPLESAGTDIPTVLYEAEQTLPPPEDEEARAAFAVQLIRCVGHRGWQYVVGPILNPSDIDWVAAHGQWDSLMRPDNTVRRYGAARAGAQVVYPWIMAPLHRVLLELLVELRQRVQTTHHAIQHPPAQPHMTQHIYGNVGMNAPGAAISQSSVTVTQTVTYEASSEVGREIVAWGALLANVEGHRHAEVRQALDTLARAADTGGLKASAGVQAAEIVVEAHPTLRQRAMTFAREWGSGAMKAAGTAAATEAGKMVVQHQQQVVGWISTALGL